MRIMTVRQPWAWAIIHGGKDVENCTRNIAGGYRGLVAIHAAAKFHDADYQLALKDSELAPIRFWGELSLGEIIGVVDLVEVHNGASCAELGADGFYVTCSSWAESDGRGMNVHLVLDNPRPLKTSIPHKGRLGLTGVSTTLEQQIWAQTTCERR